MNQKEAVFNAVMDVLSQEKVKLDDGSNVVNLLNRDRRHKVNQILFDGFKSGDIELATEFPNDSILRTYCSGLQSNWVRKDKRLNGGVPYIPKNPGSRDGYNDPSIRAMRLLLSTKTEHAERAEIQKHIDQRKAELERSRPAAPKVEIDFDALPTALRMKYGKKSSAA
jgi:hypothetical protein